MGSADLRLSFRRSAIEGSTHATQTMRAVLHTRYGDPRVLTVGEIARPVPRDDQVLIRIHAAGVSIGDHHIVSGKPYLVRLTPYGGLPGPRNLVPGGALAGQVEQVGSQVTEFRPGDEVFGQAAHGAFAEYAAIPAALLTLKPASLSLEESAAVPWGTTALQGLRDAGRLRSGQRVLINGASGAVGTWAVQLGKALGAHVTAVCSSRNVALVTDLGADAVIDYGTTDFVASGPRFDLMLDLVGNRTLADCRAILVPGGRYVSCGAGRGGEWLGPIGAMTWGLFSNWFSNTTFTPVLQSLGQADLQIMKNLIDSGRVRPVVERVWSLSEVVAALQHVGEGHSRGLHVLRLA